MISISSISKATLFVKEYCFFSESAINMMDQCQIPHQDNYVDRKDRARFAQSVDGYEYLPVIYLHLKDGTTIRVLGYDRLKEILY